MLFDTDILIWALRGNAKAIRAIDAIEEKNVSVITTMELFQGVRNKTERAAIRRFLIHFNAVPLTENIGHRASIYIEEYSLKIGIGIADALIAATAAENGLTLYTGNARHYRSISEVDLKVFKVH